MRSLLFLFLGILIGLCLARLLRECRPARSEDLDATRRN
jgi:hypothetical protein